MPLPEITELFALSAITYLHVVLSGAYPELDTIYDFKDLADTKSLHLVWPFCISGCLALDGQHAICPGLVYAAGITE